MLGNTNQPSAKDYRLVSSIDRFGDVLAINKIPLLTWKVELIMRVQVSYVASKEHRGLSRSYC